MVIVPRQFGQVLNDAMGGLIGVWKTLAVPALLVSIPVSIATTVIFAATGGSAFLDLVLNHQDRLQTLPRELFLEVARPFITAVTIAFLLQMMAGVFLALASHRAVASQLAGSPMTGGEVSRHALRRYPAGFLAMLLIVLAVAVLLGLGALLWLMPAVAVGTPNSTSVLVAILLLAVLLGPGIWVTVAVSMTTSAVAIEEAGPVTSIRRSMQLVRGRWWPTAGFLVLVGLLGGIAIQLIQLVALPLAGVSGGSAGLTIASALGVLAQGLLVAAIAAMYTYWYIDLRARREGLTTEVLS
jgi:hypothetical protein